MLGDYFPTSQYQHDFEDEKFLRLKQEIENAEVAIKELLPSQSYKVKHRMGQKPLRIAGSPWIGIHSLRDKFYQSATRGIYLTLLWKVDGSGISVSLQMGTDKSEKLGEIRSKALGLRKACGLDSFDDEIQLSSEKRGDRPWKYEQANIEGKDYDLNSISEIPEDLTLFLKSYESLIDQRQNGIVNIGQWDFTFEAKPPIGNTDSVKRKATEETVITHLHIKMQKRLYDSLVENYGDENISCEQTTTSGRPADIVVQVSPDSFEIYEIKTAKSPRDCVRQALGQLLEYSYWPGSPKSNAIWVVGPSPIDENTNEYLNFLHAEFKLPIGYVYQPVED